MFVFCTDGLRLWMVGQPAAGTRRTTWDESRIEEGRSTSCIAYCFRIIQRTHSYYFDMSFVMFLHVELLAHIWWGGFGAIHKGNETHGENITPIISIMTVMIPLLNISQLRHLLNLMR